MIETIAVYSKVSGEKMVINLSDLDPSIHSKTAPKKATKKKGK